MSGEDDGGDRGGGGGPNVICGEEGNEDGDEVAKTCGGDSGAALPNNGTLMLTDDVTARESSSSLPGLGNADLPTPVAEARGSKIVVMCACVIALMIFIYIVVRYIQRLHTQRRMRNSDREQDHRGQFIELPRMVPMYEAVGDDCKTVENDGPVVVLSLGNDPQARTMAVGVPEKG